MVLLFWRGAGEDGGDAGQLLGDGVSPGVCSGAVCGLVETGDAVAKAGVG